jgi:MinD-like ATPase involved in chromosome partitioning or flagellar assembly
MTNLRKPIEHGDYLVHDIPGGLKRHVVVRVEPSSTSDNKHALLVVTVPEVTGQVCRLLKVGDYVQLQRLSSKKVNRTQYLVEKVVPTNTGNDTMAWGVLIRK